MRLYHYITLSCTPTPARALSTLHVIVYTQQHFVVRSDRSRAKELDPPPVAIRPPPGPPPLPHLSFFLPLLVCLNASRLQLDYAFTVTVAMLEIYNEEVRDLLHSSEPSSSSAGGTGGGDGNAEGGGEGGSVGGGGGAWNGGKLEIRRDQDGVVQVRWSQVVARRGWYRAVLWNECFALG